MAMERGQMPCSACGAPVGINDRFCEACGAPQWVKARSEARWILRWVAVTRHCAMLAARARHLLAEGYVR